MKNIIQGLSILLFFLFFISCSERDKTSAQPKSEFYVASWNVENLFDTFDDPNTNDEWYLPSSEINWTEEKLIAKLDNLARVIIYMNDGNGPDLLGLQEVETQNLVDLLIEKYIEKTKYKVAYSESPDVRGIDNALIYNSDIFGIQSINSLVIIFDEPKSSRDILYVKLIRHFDKEEFFVFVNHWPSRREGLKESEKFRIKAAETVMDEVNKIIKNNHNANIIILGDFNDLPSNISVEKVLNAKSIDCDSKLDEEANLFNLSYSIFKKGEGSYKYKDDWNMLDQIIVSRSFVDQIGTEYKCNSFEIIKPEYMVEKTGKYIGTPLPTFGGRKYLGGYSDHFPVGAKFETIK